MDQPEATATSPSANAEAGAPSPSTPKPSLVGKTRDEITGLLADAGHPAFRGRQLYEWIYAKAALTFAEMTNLPIALRDWLSANYELGHPEIANAREAADGSVKLLFRLRDGKAVESVLMPERDWMTLCVSSQVGCAVACTFCMTGFGGYRRQMTTGEIVSQVLLARRAALERGAEPPRNLVFMGMGEPMLNLDAVIPAIELLTDADGIAMAPRRVTVSTSGIVPGIERLGEADLGVNIAISLNASNDAFRDEVMPINKKWPIATLLAAVEKFPLKKRRLVTFEYVLLGGLNDSPANATELVELLRMFPCKVNLIPWNPDPHLPYKRPGEATIRKFQQILLSRGLPVSVRYSKADDIGGACGQLAGHWEEGKAAEASTVATPDA